MTRKEIEALDGDALRAALMDAFAAEALEGVCCDWVLVGWIQSSMQERGYYLHGMHSPWEAPKDTEWWAGFTRMCYTGWNGRPDYQGHGSSAWVAVARAALLAVSEAR